MSGFLGIVNFDASPVDRQLLQRLTAAMRYRGPDAQRVWTSGSVGFGHALLATTRESANERQPLHGQAGTFLVADARIDGRETLRDRLRSQDIAVAQGATDADLILYAYQAWGEACVEYLIGDFSFAIWDARHQRLFCARDRFGVKPFFYFTAGDVLVFGNTFDALRRHPLMPLGLNELAIADFLLFGMPLDEDATGFGAVKRLPAAHAVAWSSVAATPYRYWSLPAGKLVRFKRAAEYVEYFRHLLGVAVGDRLRTDRVAVEMSGGLDSTAIAATARDIGATQSPGTEVHAFTFVYDRVIPDRERRYAELAARSLGIEFEHLSADDYRPFQRSGGAGPFLPEPQDQSYDAWSRFATGAISRYSRVCFNGQGGDEALKGGWLSDDVGYRSPLELAGDLLRTTFRYGRRPPLGVRSWISRGRDPVSQAEIPELPPWIDARLTKRHALEDRWHSFWSRSKVSPGVRRGRAHFRLGPDNYWSSYLEACDPGVTGINLEFRWPYLDDRLIAELLGFPSLPWFVDKLLLREALLGVVPEVVRRRPKTPLAGFPYLEHLRCRRTAWHREIFVQGGRLAGYLDKGYYEKYSDCLDPRLSWLWMLPVSLHRWFEKLGVP